MNVITSEDHSADFHRFTPFLWPGIKDTIQGFNPDCYTQYTVTEGGLSAYIPWASIIDAVEQNDYDAILPLISETCKAVQSERVFNELLYEL